MTIEYNKAQVFHYLDSWRDYDSKSISEKGAAYESVFSHGGKAVFIISPYEVGEFFLDFSENGEVIYSDWYEIMEDPLSEFMEYTKTVLDRFLLQKTRVRNRGVLFKTTKLEANLDGEWLDVLRT